METESALQNYPAYEVQWNQDTSTNTNNMLNKSDLKNK